MRRERLLAEAAGASRIWDVLVIGGGATGLGTALDAASRGLSVVLLERFDFASETSSRSTKLVHGGVRYLKQGRLGLVRASLRERGILRQNAPGLVRPLPFIIPVHSAWQKAFYGAGLKLYEGLAGSLGLGDTEVLSAEAASRELPTLRKQGLRGGVKYWDAQFNDALLAVSLARTLAAQGGLPLNYCEATALLVREGRVFGARARDSESGDAFEIQARVIVNAAGAWTDDLRRQAEPNAAPSVRISQGAHLVVGREFLPGPGALMVPQTEDGRVLFAIPWMDRCLIGTTDTPVDQARSHPMPLPAEVAFLRREAGRYLDQPIGPENILSVFAGLRPLPSSDRARRTAGVSREHHIGVSPTGLISVTGGKWTTYRAMAEEIVDTALRIGGWPPRACGTAGLAIDVGAGERAGTGSPDDEPLHPRLPVTARQVRAAADEDMARTVEDVLARRTRCLFMDVAAALEVAPRVASLLAEALGRPLSWSEDQCRRFAQIAKNYQLVPADP